MFYYFAFLLCLTECIEINFAILTTTISHFNSIQLVESLSLRQRRIKRLLLI